MGMKGDGSPETDRSTVRDLCTSIEGARKSPHPHTHHVSSCSSSRLNFQEVDLVSAGCYWSINVWSFADLSPFLSTQNHIFVAPIEYDLTIEFELTSSHLAVCSGIFLLSAHLNANLSKNTHTHNTVPNIQLTYTVIVDSSFSTLISSAPLPPALPVSFPPAPCSARFANSATT